MGRRARSSVVVLKSRRGLKGGADALEDYVPFEAADMVWSRLSQIFIGRLTDGTPSYEMKCMTPEHLNPKNECLTNKPELKLWLDAFSHTLSLIYVKSGTSIFKWDLRRGLLTLREDLLKSPDYYAGSSVPNKVVNLLQWAIECIAQYYPKDKYATLQPLTKCILLDGDKKEERDMVVYLNDDVRARYRCTEVCEVAFGAPSAPSAKAKAKAKAPSALKSSPSKPVSPLSPSAISPFQIAPTPSASKNKKPSPITLLTSPQPTVRKIATALAKPSAMQAKKETRKTDIPKQGWWARLFRRPVAL